MKQTLGILIFITTNLIFLGGCGTGNQSSKEEQEIDASVKQFGFITCRNRTKTFDGHDQCDGLLGFANTGEVEQLCIQNPRCIATGFLKKKAPRNKCKITVICQSR